MTDDELARMLGAWRPVGAPSALRFRILLRPEDPRLVRWWPAAVAASLLSIAALGLSRAADRLWAEMPVVQPTVSADAARDVIRRDLDPDAVFDALVLDAVATDARIHAAISDSRRTDVP